MDSVHVSDDFNNFVSQWIYMISKTCSLANAFLFVFCFLEKVVWKTADVKRNIQKKFLFILFFSVILHWYGVYIQKKGKIFDLYAINGLLLSLKFRAC